MEGKLVLLLYSGLYLIHADEVIKLKELLVQKQTEIEQLQATIVKEKEGNSICG